MTEMQGSGSPPWPAVGGEQILSYPWAKSETGGLPGGRPGKLHLWGRAGPPSSTWEAEGTLSQGWPAAAAAEYPWYLLSEKRSGPMEPRAGRQESACLMWTPLWWSLSERLDSRTREEFPQGERRGVWHHAVVGPWTCLRYG